MYAAKQNIQDAYGAVPDIEYVHICLNQVVTLPMDVAYIDSYDSYWPHSVAADVMLLKSLMIILRFRSWKTSSLYSSQGL